MEMIKLSKDCFVPTQNIDFFVNYATRSVIDDVKRRKKENQVFNITGGKRAVSVVYLKSGKVFLTNTSIETLSQRTKGDE